jgi:hypothetical protein
MTTITVNSRAPHGIGRDEKNRLNEQDNPEIVRPNPSHEISHSSNIF